MRARIRYGGIREIEREREGKSKRAIEKQERKWRVKEGEEGKRAR